MKEQSAASPILLDARAEFEDGPVALYEVLGRPWLATFLDMISQADALDRLTVIAPPGFQEAITRVTRGQLGGESVTVVTAMPAGTNRLVAFVNQVYVRHQFIRALRSGDPHLEAAALCTLNSPAEMKIAKEFTSRDAPGHRTALLRYIYRPIGRRIAFALTGTIVTPNTVTLTSLIIVPIASTLIAIDSYLSGIVAALLLQVFWILDLVDGTLARITKRQSKFGWWFDTMVDTIHDTALIVGFSVGALLSTGNMLLIVPAALWLISYGALNTHQLMEQIARIEHERPNEAPVAPPATARLGWSILIFYARRTVWALGKPEVVLTVYTAGLVLNGEMIVVFLFSSLYTYRLFRMFGTAYTRYRRTEVSAQG